MWIIFTENALLFITIFIVFALVIGVFFAIKIDKRKTIMENYLSNDDRFINSKTFMSELNIPIKVSEKGFVGIVDHFIGELKIIDVKDITGYELQINENRNTFESIGLSFGALFGNLGNIEKKIKSIKIILKIDNFDEPIVEIPFLTSEIEMNSKKYDVIINEINKFIGTLDYLRKNIERS